MAWGSSLFPPFLMWKTFLAECALLSIIRNAIYSYSRDTGSIHTLPSSSSRLSTQEVYDCRVTLLWRRTQLLNLKENIVELPNDTTFFGHIPKQPNPQRPQTEMVSNRNRHIPCYISWWHTLWDENKRIVTSPTQLTSKFFRTPFGLFVGLEQLRHPGHHMIVKETWPDIHWGVRGLGICISKFWRLTGQILLTPST